MNNNVKTNTIPFASLQALYRFESDLCETIKGLLNQSYRHIGVNANMTVLDWNGAPVKVVHNASDAIERSADFVGEVNKFISTRDDIGDILANAYSIVVELKLSMKITADAKKPETKEKEPAVEFYPSTPRYNFDQIILDEAIRTEIFDAVKIIECKDLIYNKWGFGDIDPVPRSILNFYGEPGTGKTMCAHAIANHLGKKLLALNYSEIESKYVGEAPKNLQKAFDVAKATDSVLFFDEADSFLGKRIENVTQGADQALNSLRSQMLILLEEFAGVVMFATNLVTNFDPAFESRILKHIRFDLPNREARAAILKKMIPSRLPVQQPFTDEEYLAASDLIDGFSGREIKGAVLDMLLEKADPAAESIVFTIDDLYTVLEKRKKAKKELKEQEERRIKDKISKKLKEKAEEARAIKEQEEQLQEEPSENEQEADKDGEDQALAMQ
ncbi:MAG: ATP-binding protein [Bacteroidaceae bacterium]|nr:ATP-binding protein [Bacteroidaceae bacterium]